MKGVSFIQRKTNEEVLGILQGSKKGYLLKAIDYRRGKMFWQLIYNDRFLRKVIEQKTEEKEPGDLNEVI